VPSVVVKGQAGEAGILMVSLKQMVYVEEKAQYIPESEATESMSIKHISSAELRRRLEYSLDIPEWFSYPEIVEELRRAYPPRSKQGFTILMTGLSGSGKSTLAKMLIANFWKCRIDLSLL